MTAPGASDTLAEAVRAGVVVAQSTQAGSGRVFRDTRSRELGFISTDDLDPQKARPLLAPALTVTDGEERIAAIEIY